MVTGMHGRQLGRCYPNFFQRGCRREQLLGECLGVSGIDDNFDGTQWQEMRVHTPATTKACIGMNETSLRTMGVRALADGVTAELN